MFPFTFTFPDKEIKLETYKLLVITFVVVTPFDTYKLPVTWRFAVASFEDPIDTPGM